MKWFKPSQKNTDLINLLKQSSTDFGFDPNNVKYRLLTSIRSADQKPVHHFRFSRVMRYSASFAGLVVMISTTFAFASNAKPGDKLFALNKMGENAILALPMPAEQKAKVQEYIVTSRLEALDNVTVQSNDLETLKESDESLTHAVDAITKNKKRLEASGKSAAAAKLEQVLDQLQSKAQNREAIIKQIEERAKDEETRSEIRKHLQQIEDSKQKARSEIKRFNEEYQDSNDED